MNDYSITYQIVHSPAGIVREQVSAASEQQARDLIRAKYHGQEVRIVEGHMTHFGGARDDDRRDRR